MTSMAIYQSYLVRLWREPASSDSFPSEWHGEIENIQSSQCWSFDKLDDLLEFVRHWSEITDRAEG